MYPTLYYKKSNNEVPRKNNEFPRKKFLEKSRLGILIQFHSNSKNSSQ